MTKLFIVLTLLTSMAFTGCASKKAQTATDDGTVENVIEGSDSIDSSLRTVYFDFNSSQITGAAQEVISANVDYLKENQNIKIQIEGHCDERGGVQFNLALGERRANAVRNYMVAKGIPYERITIISYGKERPVEFGHDEASWSKNRRAAFIVTAR